MSTRSVLTVWLVWLLALSAQAQVTPAEKAAAEALFDRGTTLLREGKLEEACARLEQSQAIERGLGTMLYLAECYERTGRTASAWALFREASSEARASGQTERAEAGRLRAERLEPMLSRLTIEVPEDTQVPGLEVLRNGTPLPKGAWNEPLPVDPGEHRISARASGYLPHEQTVVIEKGPSVKRVEVPQLEAAPVAEAPPEPTPALPAVVDASAEAQPVQAPERPGRAQRITGIVLGSVGVAMLAVGGGMGIRAIKQKNRSNDLCPGEGTTCGDPDGVQASKDAKKAANISTGGFIAGGALIAGGLVTYLLAPRSDTRVGFAVDRQMAGINVGGVF